MKNRTNVRWLTQLALLVAILLVLNYTPLGYLQIGPLSASLLTVPVAIGAMTMGPMAGAILGGVFGATSFIQMVEGKSAMGAALFQVSPVGSFVVSFVARVLMGLCAGLIFAALRKALPKNEKLCCFLGGLSAPVLNTVFFMGFLVLIFYNSLITCRIWPTRWARRMRSCSSCCWSACRPSSSGCSAASWPVRSRCRCGNI